MSIFFLRKNTASIQKEAAEIFETQNEERRLGEFNSHGVLKAMKRHCVAYFGW